MGDQRRELDPILRRSLQPVLVPLADLLLDLDLGPDDIEAVLEAVGEAYARGHVDGARDAIGQIAPEAERHGMHLRLGPGLEAPP